MVIIILPQNGRVALVFMDLTNTELMDLTNAQGDLQGQLVRDEAQMHGRSFNGPSNTCVPYVTQRSAQRMFDNFCGVLQY